MALKTELVESLKRMGFVNATEVQEKSIPEVLQRKNVIVRARTGTGKTGAFMVPIFQMIGRSKNVEALVIVPTRELALQVSTFAQKVGNPLHIYTTTIYGGASINLQMQSLRSCPNVVVGTPGRLIDLYKRGALNLDAVRFIVLDEADLMLDMGFITDVEYLLSKTPFEKQTLLFSATMPREIVRMTERYANGKIDRIIVGEEEDITVSTIKHLYALVPSRLKFAALLAYIKEYSPRKAIIFARTKFEANSIHRVLLSQSYEAILLHGGLTQATRERSLGSFKKGAQFMVATNVAARGLDIADVTDVINFGAPEEANVYIHRVGRSARMGKEGRAMTIADPEQKREIRDIEDSANINMSKIDLDVEPFRNLPLPIRAPDRERRFGGGRRGGFDDTRGGDRGGSEHGSGSRGGSRGHGGRRPFRRF
ncbi:putative ATP-dependent RNA helicase [uncultured archaeon]|nr:putative ATP-dependent RNA helicase [uncultured archaeon]